MKTLFVLFLRTLQERSAFPGDTPVYKSGIATGAHLWYTGVSFGTTLLSSNFRRMGSFKGWSRVSESILLAHIKQQKSRFKITNTQRKNNKKIITIKQLGIFSRKLTRINSLVNYFYYSPLTLISFDICVNNHKK